ncbi:MAG: hypothetical protein ACJ735_04360 [Actinomycetes bacterium]
MVAYVALAVGISLWVWTLNYEPIRLGNGLMGAGRVVGPVNGAFHPDHVIANYFGTEYQVDYPQVGDTVGVAVAVRNSGHHAVRVTGVSLPLWPQDHWVRMTSYMSLSPLGTGLPSAPFHAFTLAPGENRDLFVTLTFEGCPRGTSAVPNAQLPSRAFQAPVVMSTAYGVHHAKTLDLDGSVLSIRGWPLCD